VVVVDLETQRSAAEVGGWSQIHRMGLSLGVCWDSRLEEFITYREEQVQELLGHLQRADLVVGFNLLGFDYTVLRGYTSFDFSRLNTLDILRELQFRLNHRVSLDSLARATLQVAKLGDGLQALAWWKEGRFDLLEEYCRQDVRVTRDLFHHGLEHGHLFFDRKNGSRARVQVDWKLDALAARRPRA
jgi:DEAD/DEAH box helicase domain-containing protein